MITMVTMVTLRTRITIKDDNDDKDDNEDDADKVDNDGNDDYYEVDRILDTRVRNKKREFLISWKGYGPEENLWLPASFKKHNPEEYEREQAFLQAHPTTSISSINCVDDFGGAVTYTDTLRTQ
jgi:hypothetical protein